MTLWCRFSRWYRLRWYNHRVNTLQELLHERMRRENDAKVNHRMRRPT